jgi:hypothetical protein
VVGSALLKSEQAARLKETDIGKRFWQVLYSLSLIVSTANGALQLPHNVNQLLIAFGVASEGQTSNEQKGLPSLIEIQAAHEEIAPGDFIQKQPADAEICMRDKSVVD